MRIFLHQSEVLYSKEPKAGDKVTAKSSATDPENLPVRWEWTYGAGVSEGWF